MYSYQLKIKLKGIYEIVKIVLSINAYLELHRTTNFKLLCIKL